MDVNVKNRIAEAMQNAMPRFSSQARLAQHLQIKPAILSRVLNGERDSVLSDAAWIQIAIKLDLQLNESVQIVPAKTPVYQYLTARFKECQERGVSSLFCDDAGVGKTFAAKLYVKQNRNAVYVDGSLHSSRSRLLRALAVGFGISPEGRLDDIKTSLVYYINQIETPLIIIDEGGDLKYEAFTELKSIWNATEYRCGMVMLGADGLKAKIKRSIQYQKIGYAEMFRRLGERYDRLTPEGKTEREAFDRTQIAAIAKANGIENVQELYAKTQGSLTRCRIEVSKLKKRDEKANG